MKKVPLISVILPVRNAGSPLQQAVSSLLTQTVDDIEIVLIDDFSDDNAISALTGLDQRLRVIDNTRPGLVHALNLGLRHANGEWIARMDGDDIAMPNRLERQLTFARGMPNPGLVGAEVEIFCSDRAVGDGFKHYQDWINSLNDRDTIYREIFVECPLPHPTFFAHRTLFDRLGGYRDCGWPEDYDLCLRAWRWNIPMAKPRGRLLRWRDHDGRFSRISPNYASNKFVALKAQFLSELTDSPATIWGAGRGGKRLCDALTALGGKVDRFVDVSAKRIGQRVRGRPVFAPDAIDAVSPPLFVAVGTRGVNRQIRAFLAQRGWREGSEYWFTA